MTAKELGCLTVSYRKWGGNMRKISGLTLHNLKKDRGQYISFGIIILLTAFILNLALVLLFQVDKAYDKRFSELNTSNINFCIPKTQDINTLSNECGNVDGVGNLESREGLFTDATIKDFRGTDFSINTVFYNIDDTRKLNKFEIKEESNDKFSPSVYVPLYVAQFGEFSIGDKITYQIDGKDYTFYIAGILEEMQYGNAGNAVLGAYLPNETYQSFAGEIEECKVTEYSLVTEDGVVIEDVKNKINSLFSKNNISLLFILDSDKCKQVRTMVCSLLIIVLIAFSFVVFLVSILLCKFRIQNTIEEEIINMGVLKAVGYTGNMIICATVIPYVIVSIVTALLGVSVSYFLLPVLAQVLALQSGFSFALKFDIATLCLTLLILTGMTLLFSYFASKRIKKLQPINAIRGNGESRHGRKNYFPLDKAAGNLQINLILKQVALSAKQNVLLFIVSFFLTVLLAFAGTLFYNAVIKPENFTSTLSEETPEIILQVKSENIQRLKNDLRKDPQIERVLEYFTDTVNTPNGSMKAFVCEDFSFVANDLCYDGRNPETDNEIAVGSALADEYSIGDKIEVEYEECSYTYDIVGFIQSVNFQGEICELTRNGYLNINSEYSSQYLYLYLKNVDEAEKVIEAIQNKYADDIFESVNSYKTTKISQEMYSSIVVIIVTAVFILSALIVLLILYIIIKSLIVRRKQELGIYKAMGYSNMQLIIQIAGSFLPVSFIAILLSILSGLWYIPAINQVIFQMVGAMKNNFEVPLIFLISVGLLQISVNFIISICLSWPIKKISVYSLIKE